EEQARRAAEEQARIEADKKRFEAEALARFEAEFQAKREAEERARLEAARQQAIEERRRRVEELRIEAQREESQRRIEEEAHQREIRRQAEQEKQRLAEMNRREEQRLQELHEQQEQQRVRELELKRIAEEQERIAQEEAQKRIEEGRRERAQAMRERVDARQPFQLSDGQSLVIPLPGEQESIASLHPELLRIQEYGAERDQLLVGRESHIPHRHAPAPPDDNGAAIDDQLTSILDTGAPAPAPPSKNDISDTENTGHIRPAPAPPPDDGEYEAEAQALMQAMSALPASAHEYEYRYDDAVSLQEADGALPLEQPRPDKTAAGSVETTVVTSTKNDTPGQKLETADPTQKKPEKEHSQTKELNHNNALSLAGHATPVAEVESYEEPDSLGKLLLRWTLRLAIVLIIALGLVLALDKPIISQSMEVWQPSQDSVMIEKFASLNI
ncbi:MAG: hypothetical protein Q4P66_10135, partial [Actinomycetaceae bacterium]|nr:hypothetical protein [Actinomycetaceae bacterium]